MKPIRIFAPITRIDAENRIVEGYAFVNETVPGEGGIRLKRSAMEAATPEYLRSGTVRAMHQPIAAGKPLEVEWDATGAYLRAKIVDDQEWRKVTEEVYKGFSIGVNALTARGKDVETCEWWDSSLVDRGKDKDALFTIWHAKGDGEEREVEELPELDPAPAIIARSFDDYLEAIQEEDVRQDLYAAWSWFMDCCWGCMDDPAALALNLDQFTAYCKTVIGGEMTEARAAVSAAIKRFKAPVEEALPLARLSLPQGWTEQQVTEFRAQWDEALARDYRGTIVRAQTAESELARVQDALSAERTALATAKEQVTRLENMPVRRPPVKYAAALVRTFTANEVDGVDPAQVEALQAELKTLNEELPKETDEKKRNAGVAQFMAVQGQLRKLGFDA